MWLDNLITAWTTQKHTPLYCSDSIPSKLQGVLFNLGLQLKSRNYMTYIIAKNTIKASAIKNAILVFAF